MSGRRGSSRCNKCSGSGELSGALPSAELGGLRHVEGNCRHDELGLAGDHDPGKSCVEIGCGDRVSSGALEGDGVVCSCFGIEMQGQQPRGA